MSVTNRSDNCDVLIVGAGPYGVSLAAQLRAGGVDYRIFGTPMKMWRELPPGLFLKVYGFAASLPVPGASSFPEWSRQRGLEDFEPCTMKSFTDYGLWVQDRFVPDVEETDVARIAGSSAGGFEVRLTDGRQVGARRVVVATGLYNLAYVPPELQGLPQGLVRHTFDIPDYSKFHGRHVAVIGAGASAIEAGALVHEAGGTAEVLVRADHVYFQNPTVRARTARDRLKQPMSVVGTGRRNLFLQEFPLAVHFMSDERRLRWLNGFLQPSAPWWIKDRIDGKVPLRTSTRVMSAQHVGEKVRLELDTPEGSRTVLVDHVIAGTGFEMDVGRLAFLDPSLRQNLKRVAASPALSMNFESSVEGLYFVGPLSGESFGPLFRFIPGAEFTTTALARHFSVPRNRGRSGINDLRSAVLGAFPYSAVRGRWIAT